MRPLLAVALIASLAGCTAIRPLGDGGAGRDAGRRADAGPPTDAGAPDAGPRVDAGADAGCVDSRLGTPCDGPDADECEEGVFVCAPAGVVCDDATDDTLETCGGGDEDCDGAVDEGTPSDAPTWGRDDDADRYGASAGAVTQCAAPSARHVTMLGDCDDADEDVFPGATESCDGVDDDCDGMVDEGVSCHAACVRRSDGARTYQFCAVNTSWTTARSVCQSFGYDLVVIDDAAEDAFLFGQIAALPPGGSDTYWIGLRRPGLLLRPHEWVDGSSLTYSNWAGAEPDAGDLFVRMATRDGRWSDVALGPSSNAICEAP